VVFWITCFKTTLRNERQVTNWYHDKWITSKKLLRQHSVKIENEDLFDSYQVTYNIFEQSTYAILKHLLQLGKTVIIKEALANGRIFKNENSAIIKALSDCIWLKNIR
jgi:aryl-alcohol dehydrogenase-like predicted oxidoreductase